MTYHNLMILDGHVSYHALQPLDLSCFKPFKIALGKKMIMVRNNRYEPNKNILVNWVNKVLDTFDQKNIKNGFKVIRIWPLNPKAMDLRRLN